MCLWYGWPEILLVWFPAKAIADGSHHWVLEAGFHDTHNLGY